MSIQPKKHKMPSQEPSVRAKNFEAVALGFTASMAIDEAKRCLNCKTAPCVSGCPVNINIPSFLSMVKEGDFANAYNEIAKSSSLPAVCGRVCPQEKQCESKCTMGIKFESVAIGSVERFVADYHNENCKSWPENISNNGHKVAVIGSGPSGLACAGDLAKKGYEEIIVIAQDTTKYGIDLYGKPRFAELLAELAETAEEVPAVLNVAHAQVEIDIDNFIFRLVERTGICNVKGYAENGKVKLTTEIGYAQIGDSIKILMMPGEVFPEIVYGGFLGADEAYNGTEYPYAALNTHFDESDSILTFGLCNDAIGYIVPDNDYRFSLVDGAHSHETISAGPRTASAISAAFEKLLSEYK